jgi:hypothetical protein
MRQKVRGVALNLSDRVVHRRALIGVLIAFTLGCCAYTALNAPLGGDYPGPTCKGCDYAGPPIEALASGHIGKFFSTQPVMGSFTLLLRVPGVAVARSLGAGELAQYRVGSLICLLFAAALAWVIVVLMRPRGKQWWLVGVLLGVLLAGPITAKALVWGHPEELVGALLCVLAVVLASRRRVVLAGVALGLALATKQWAVLAILPTVIACPGQRTRLLTVMAGVAAVFILPMLIGDPGRFADLNFRASLATGNGSQLFVTPTNIWFPYGKQAGFVLGPGGGSQYTLSSSLANIVHPLLLVVCLAVTLIYWRGARRRSADDLVLLLALLFLLRCLLDPLATSYHHVPFFVAIASYEALRRRGIPFITIYSAIALWALGKWVAPTGDGATFNQLYLAWALPVAAYLGYKTLSRRGATLTSQPTRQAASPVGVVHKPA